jgi:hemerythrin
MHPHPWSDDYNILLPRFDNEHRILLGMLNDLLSTAELPHGVQHQVIMNKLLELHAGALLHFASEERFMAGNGYPVPHLEEHRRKHAGLVQELEGFMARYDQLRSPLSPNMIIFLTDWLISHLIVDDRKMGNYFCNCANLVYD